MSYVENGGERLYYEAHGSGVPLLLISGTAWSGEHWKLETVPAFEAEYQVIIFDHRGVGRSARPATGYSTRQFAADAVAVLDAAGVSEPAHVLGHSMGGRVAQWIALDHPDVVRSLVLASTGPGQIDDRERLRGISPEMAFNFVRLGWPGFMEDSFRSRNVFYRPEPEMVERFMSTHRGQFGTDLLSYLRHVVARQQHETTNRLHEITQPCLVIVGDQEDDSVGGSATHSETCEYLAKHLPNVEHIVIPDTAHALHIESAVEFNQAVHEFLGRH